MNRMLKACYILILSLFGLGASGGVLAAICDVSVSSIVGQTVVLQADCGSATTSITWIRTTAGTPTTLSSVTGFTSTGSKILYTTPLLSGVNSYTATTTTGSGGPATPNLVATITGAQWLLTVAPTVGGSVQSTPAGIDTCTSISSGGTCGNGYDNGTAVILTPTANGGSVFNGWAGDCSGTGTCVLAMTAPRTVIATFGSTPTPGTCGSASNSTPVGSAPSGGGLCSSGTATAVASPSASPWSYTWGCNGINGGSGTSATACSAPKIVAGICGTASGGSAVSATPSGTAACNPGSVTGMTAGATAFTWTCGGFNTGAASALCSVNIIATNGACAAAYNTASTPGAEGCTSGSISSIVAPGTPGGNYTYSCAGLAGGTTATGCIARQTVNGACGSAGGVSVASAPASNLCVAGSTATAVSGAGPWTWGCNGVNGGTSTTATTCSAPLQSASSCGASEVMGTGDLTMASISTTTLFPIPPVTGSGDLGRAIRFTANGTAYPNGVSIGLIDESPTTISHEVVISACPHSYTPVNSVAWCRMLGSAGSRPLYFYSAAAGKTTPGTYDCVLQAGTDYYINFRSNVTPRGTVSSQFGFTAR